MIIFSLKLRSLNHPEIRRIVDNEKMYGDVCFIDRQYRTDGDGNCGTGAERSAEVVLCTASTLPAAELPTITHWALGCSAHGVEELDEAEFMPALEQIEPYLRGKPVLLFGSYGWGAGAYMKPWEERTPADRRDSVRRRFRV